MAGHDSSVMVCETGPGHDGSGMQEVEQDASQRGSAGHGLLQQPGGSLSSSAPAITLPTDHSSLAKHLKELDAKQDQLKTLLSRTRSLLFGFHQQCKTNPSSEVPSPAAKNLGDAQRNLWSRPTLTLLLGRWRG